ncbi:MAG TPA: BTAD domain-containing putative transcriptional regulator [Longimicrobium sp.]|nr:BTAD domain-containing putative transcriptional regulator [Longimicrobium sp.]
MKTASPDCPSELFLVTLGTPALVARGTPVPLRKKDLALLVYLRLEGRHGHSRGALAGLLWGSSPDENARHSLTQAIGRLRARVGDVLEVAHDRVACRAALACDAAALQQAAASGPVDESVLALCAGEFLSGFAPGRGAEAFETWADGRRAHLRTVAVAVLDRLGTEAEERGEWERALAAAQRTVALDPAAEPAHRRIMRAWSALGHRVRALQHYDRLVAWLIEEFQTDPEPETAALAEQLRTRIPRPARPAAPEPPVVRVPRPFPDPVPAPDPHGGSFPSPHPARTRPGVQWAWGAAAVLLAVLWSSGARRGGGRAPQRRTDDRPPRLDPPLAGAGDPVARLEDWLRTDGRWIYYRYGAYLPGACEHPTAAVGNWGKDGASEGAGVHCIGEEWLALDVERLGERFAIAPETTYCLDFVYVAGNTSYWGQHGSLGAPGLDEVRMAAADGSYRIGFAVVREAGGRRRVQLTNAYPGPRC